tara:strand:- start:4342 stop:4758 length:417 start_codon:yes stop_codon:yes gene_type:complete
VAHQARERVPVAGGVEQDHGLVVKTKLTPCEHLEELVERPGPARKHHDGIRIHEHHLLALVHVLGDHETREVALADLEVEQVGRDHPEGPASGLLRRLRHRAHQPDIARTIDQLPVPVGQKRPHGARVSLEGRIRAET